MIVKDEPVVDSNLNIEALTETYAQIGRERGIFYLENMARLYARIGRVAGSDEKPWITKVPKGLWAIQDLDYRIVAQLCDYLACSPSDFGL